MGAVLLVESKASIQVRQISHPYVEQARGHPPLNPLSATHAEAGPDPWAPSILLSAAFANDRVFDTLGSPLVPLKSI
jgi:hypothetical protein